MDARLLVWPQHQQRQRGVAQAASIVYWIGAPHVRRGYMVDAAKACLPFAFGTLRPASAGGACLPHNTVLPAAVLEKVGFKREGMARRYLRINGVWQDHDLFRAAGKTMRACRRRGA